jgi:hypothetical protein
MHLKILYIKNPSVIGSSWNLNPVTDGLIYFLVDIHNTVSHVKKIKGIGKVHPRTGHEGPGGE